MTSTSHEEARVRLAVLEALPPPEQLLRRPSERLGSDPLIDEVLGLIQDLAEIQQDLQEFQAKKGSRYGQAEAVKSIGVGKPPSGRAS